MTPTKAPAPEAKRPRGRPPKAPEETLVLRSIRLTPAMWEKVDQYGIAWLRGLIERARPPKT